MIEEGRCLSCEYGHEAADKFRLEALANHGWTGAIGPDQSSPYGFRYQTEGFRTKYPGALDIQFVYPIGKLAHALACLYKEKHLDKGIFPKPGDKSTNLLEGYTVEFAQVFSEGQRLLRVILPDQTNSTNYKTMDQKYRGQWEGVVLESSRS